MEEIVLCASSAYEKKYYLDERFYGLPEAVQNELKIACVVFTEEVGGVLTVLFDEDGEIVLNPQKEEDDILYDDIACGMLIRRLERDYEELWRQLEAYYKAFIIQSFD